MTDLQTIAVVIITFGIIITFSIAGIAIKLTQIEDKINKLEEEKKYNGYSDESPT